MQSSLPPPGFPPLSKLVTDSWKGLFENTAAGAEQFWEFAEPLIRAEGKKVKVCTVTLAEDGGAIMNWLLDEDFGPASISRYAFREFASKHGQPAESAEVAAKACLAILPFIRRAQ